MRDRLAALCVCFFAVIAPAVAKAEVSIEVDVASQVMEVYVNGGLRHTWRVSTGRDGFETPNGSFRAKRLEEEWYSTQYEDAPMPHAIFFAGGYAIHGTYQTRYLGRRASHGCVRLSPNNAARLFDLVSGHGLRNTIVSIND